jgi:(4-(4-[2-(gamma-L-glutamylamino)ethyl]phenoxymethyl)furan-2-yl)methanamine synthase
MTETSAIGWDLGGAHLKAVVADAGGRIAGAWQVPCTLWRGMEHLTAAIEQIRPQIQGMTRHGLTMTGELVDLFESRADGVGRLTTAAASSINGADLRIYGGRDGFHVPSDAVRHWHAIASANWHASAAFVSSRIKQGLFVDVGSTTSDLVAFRDGRVEFAGYSDEERLTSEELVYAGVTRTPVMAIADRVPFAGASQLVMAEHFATMADIHRLTGELPADADQQATADGRGKTLGDSARRLARMLGRDADPADLAPWRQLAWHLSERQSDKLHTAADRVLSKSLLAGGAPLVGAGVGRFLAKRLAERLRRPYVDFSALVSGEVQATEWAARCAPAAAVAILAARW